MSSPPSPKPSKTSIAGTVAVVLVTVALSLLMLGWALPAIRSWCLFAGVTLLLTTVGGTLSVWLIRQPAPASGSSSGSNPRWNLEQSRARFVKSLEAAPTWGQAVGRSGTAAQTAYY